MVRRRRGGGGSPGGSSPGGPSAAERIFEDVSCWEARTIQVATALDLFTLLADGPATAEDVAVRIGADRRATELLLNALCEVGYLSKRADRYANAAHAQSHLVRGQRGYVGWSVLFEASSWDRWGKLEEAIRTGKRPAGSKLFSEDADRSKTLLRAIHARAEALFVRQVVEKVRLDDASSLLDLGGGAGTYAIALCRRWPKLQATLLDLPIAIELARETTAKTDVHKRIALVEGDYHVDPFGGPFDVVFASNVVHMEGEAGLKSLLKRAFDALHPGGRLVIRDMLLADDRTGPKGAVFSLNMLLQTEGGRCYSAGELSGWLREAGYRDVRALEPHVLLEGRKPGPRPAKAEPAKTDTATSDGESKAPASPGDATTGESKAPPTPGNATTATPAGAPPAARTPETATPAGSGEGS